MLLGPGPEAEPPLLRPTDHLPDRGEIRATEGPAKPDDDARHEGAEDREGPGQGQVRDEPEERIVREHDDAFRLPPEEIELGRGGLPPERAFRREREGHDREGRVPEDPSHAADEGHRPSSKLPAQAAHDDHEIPIHDRGRDPLFLVALHLRDDPLVHGRESPQRIGAQEETPRGPRHRGMEGVVQRDPIHVWRRGDVAERVASGAPAAQDRDPRALLVGSEPPRLGHGLVIGSWRDKNSLNHRQFRKTDIASSVPGAMAREAPPTRAEVVVVGGGCMGTSVAFHLARRGLRVALLERDRIASGATGHSGAIVRQHYETRVGIRLARDSLAFFRRFEAETGSSCDLRPTGFLTGTRRRDFRAFEGLVALLRSEGVRAERLTPSETKALEPRLQAEDYVALVHDPDAGYADPIATATGLASAAERDGARISQGLEAREVIARNGRVDGVRLRGDRVIRTTSVVLAAGNWTPRLAAATGPRLPVRFVRGEVAVLRRPPDFGPPPKIHFDFYGDTYSRPEGDKDVLVGYMHMEPRGSLRRPDLADDSVPGATVRDLRSRLSGRFPAMARAQPRGGWAGVYDVTPDGYPILDRLGPDGLYVAAGFSGHGFKLSPEVGRLLAEFIATGRRPGPLASLRASRFEENESVVPDAPFPARRGSRLP